MNWIGKWKNQYGSILEITRQEEGMIEGYFSSAVDQTTKDQRLPVTGTCLRNLIALSCAGGDHVVTYAGMFTEEKLQTMWFVVSESSDNVVSEQGVKKEPTAWWRSVKTNADTFERA